MGLQIPPPLWADPYPGRDPIGGQIVWGTPSLSGLSRYAFGRRKGPSLRSPSSTRRPYASVAETSPRSDRRRGRSKQASSTCPPPPEKRANSSSSACPAIGPRGGRTGVPRRRAGTGLVRCALHFGHRLCRGRALPSAHYGRPPPAACPAPLQAVRHPPQK